MPGGKGVSVCVSLLEEQPGSGIEHGIGGLNINQVEEQSRNPVHHLLLVALLPRLHHQVVEVKEVGLQSSKEICLVQAGVSVLQIARIGVTDIAEVKAVLLRLSAQHQGAGENPQLHAPVAVTLHMRRPVLAR